MISGSARVAKLLRQLVSSALQSFKLSSHPSLVRLAQGACVTMFCLWVIRCIFSGSSVLLLALSVIICFDS